MRCKVLLPLKAGDEVTPPGAEIDLDDAIVAALPAGTVEAVPQTVQEREDAMRDTVDAIGSGPSSEKDNSDTLPPPGQGEERPEGKPHAKDAKSHSEGGSSRKK